MREHTDLTREEYELTKVALAREDVPAEALALLSTWIEGERLLVDDREGVGGGRISNILRLERSKTGLFCEYVEIVRRKS